MTSQSRIIKIVVVVTVVFCAAVSAAVLAFTGAANKAAGRQADRVVAAIAQGRPALAPAGAADYVRGVRRIYGPVSGVRLVKVRHLSIDEHTDDNSHHDQEVAEILVRGRRGAALLELSFGTGQLSPGNQPVQGLRELGPGQIPSGLIDAATKRQIEAGVRARGGVATDAALSTDFAAVAGAPRAAPHAGSGPDAAQRRLHRLTACMKRAAGNPAALLRCQG
jgi:hypothetical protein